MEEKENEKKEGEVRIRNGIWKELQTDGSIGKVVGTREGKASRGGIERMVHLENRPCNKKSRE